MIESNSIRPLGWMILPVRFAPLISVVSRVKLLIQPDIGHSSQNNLILVISPSNQKYAWHDGIQFFHAFHPHSYRWMQQINLTLITLIGSMRIGYIYLVIFHQKNGPFMHKNHTIYAHGSMDPSMGDVWFRWIVLIPNRVLLGAREDLTDMSICPIGSMYGIFTYIWLIFMVNVGQYAIHGSYGFESSHHQPWLLRFFLENDFYSNLFHT